jgi:hypothetical protein
MMSHKAQPSTPSSTGELCGISAIYSSWSTPPIDLRDAKFLRSWLEYDSEIPDQSESEGKNLKPTLGLAIAFGISAGFWAVIGVTVARILN